MGSLLEKLDIFKQPYNSKQLSEEQLNELVSIGTSDSNEKTLSEQLKQFGKKFKDEQNESDMKPELTRLALVCLSQNKFTAQSDNNEKVVQVFNNLVLPNFDEDKLVKYFQSLENTSLDINPENLALKKKEDINKEEYANFQANEALKSA